MSDEIKGLQAAQQSYDNKEPVYDCSPGTASMLDTCNKIWNLIEKVYDEINKEHCNKNGDPDQAEIHLGMITTRIVGLLLDLKEYRKNA